ncbi:hypothetical protein R3W88_014486 [Solanum pinnatisectum]|uniref:RNase H type-1 domain-containing protein n=1 Tax=Solanum pinnatisectum TaxID=50273 RepID=A0AAV9KSJ0_9SOLN|nr:hypothetical protein R3W88_014486 [Solanum pinnatisectum]
MEKPQYNWVKVNIDCSCNSEGSIGVGGIIRDSMGNLIVAFAKHIGRGTSNIGEAKAAYFGAKWCVENGYPNFSLECDSLVKDKSQMAWKLWDTIMETRRINLQANVIVQHCFREVIQAADIQAKYYLYSKDVLIFDPIDLPKDEAGMYTIDIIWMPSLRHIYAKKKYILIHYL